MPYITPRAGNAECCAVSRTPARLGSCTFGVGRFLASCPKEAPQTKASQLGSRLSELDLAEADFALCLRCDRKLKGKEPSSTNLGTVGHFDPPAKGVPRRSGHALLEDFDTQLDRYCLCGGDVRQLHSDVIQHQSAVANMEEIARHQRLPLETRRPRPHNQLTKAQLVGGPKYPLEARPVILSSILKWDWLLARGGESFRRIYCESA